MKALILGVIAILFPWTAADALSTITQVTPRNASYCRSVLQVTPRVEKNGDLEFAICVPNQQGPVRVTFMIWDKPVPVSADAQLDTWPREGMQLQASCAVEGKPGKDTRCYGIRVSREMLHRSAIWVNRNASDTAFDAWEIVLGEFVSGAPAK